MATSHKLHRPYFVDVSNYTIIGINGARYDVRRLVMCEPYVLFMLTDSEIIPVEWSDAPEEMREATRVFLKGFGITP